MPDSSTSYGDNPGTAIGFDFGLKRIGIACGNPNTGSTNPLTTIRNINGRPQWEHIDEIVEQWRPFALVVGLPLYEAPTAQPMELAAKAFARRLGKRYGLPTHLHNESHSSNEAGRIIAHNRRTQGRQKTRPGDIDKIAAALILENWFDEARPTL
jgi:putative Holliday junction resolvase